MLTLHTLGECRLAVASADGGGCMLAPDADRLFSLALLLAGECGRAVPRGQAAEWVWPELPASGARRCLRQALYRLRAVGVPVGADADHLCVPRDRVTPTFAARPTAAALHAEWADGSLRLGRCLPGWAPAGDALRAWADDYRARVEGAARRVLGAALDGTFLPEDGLTTAPPAVELARALLALDPAHPAAREVAAAQASPARRVGDADEVLAVLDARWAAARAGAGGLVILAGTPGGGASRLLLAFAARVAGAHVAWADCATGASPTAALARAGADAAGGPLVICLDHAERAGAAALAEVAAAAATWVDAPGLVVVACAGAWPCGGAPPEVRERTTSGQVARERAARRWGSRLGEVARAVADERPLLVRVGAGC